MSTPVAGSLSVTPLYASAADVLVLWDDVNATWRSLPSVSNPMSVAQGGTGQTTLALNRPLIGNGTSPVLSSTIVTDNGTTLRVSTNVVIGNPVTSPPAHALVVNDAATMPQAYGAGVPRVWGAAETSAALALMDSYGASAAQYIGRRSRGTAAAPTAVQSGDNLMVVGASGRGATNYSGNVSALIALATENWSDTAQGVAIAFNTTTNTTTATNERMRIDHNGNVGIGTTAPGAPLDVVGGGSGAKLIVRSPTTGAGNAYNDIQVRNDINSNLRTLALSYTGSTFPSAYWSGGVTGEQGAIGTTGNFPLTFGTNNTARVLIDASGNVGIGTTVPGKKLDVNGSAKVTDLYIAGNTAVPAVATFVSTYTCLYAIDAVPATATGGVIAIGNSGSPTTAHRQGTHAFQDRANTTTYCQFSAAGTANVSGAWTVISDLSTKQDVKPYTRGLDAIVALNPVEFCYAAGTPFAEADKPSRSLFGLIADEVKPYVPEIVGTTKATIGKKENVELATLEPGNLIYALINAMKEMNAEVQDLAAKVAALESGLGSRR